MEDHYSSEDEEVYFGSLARSEVSTRQRFLGDNYNSPVTPRPPRFNHASNGTQRSLPDILGTSSTPIQKQLPAGSGDDESTPPMPPVDSPRNESDDVIILDSSRNFNSIITLSDDESFIINEETCLETSLRGEGRNQSMAKKSFSISNTPTENETAKVSEPRYGSFSSDKGVDTCHGLAEDQSLHESSMNNSGPGLAEDKSLHKSSMNNSGPGFAEDKSLHESSMNNSGPGFAEDKSLHESSMNNSGPGLAEDKSLHESIMNNSDKGHILDQNSSLNNFQTNNLQTTADRSCELNPWSNRSSSLVQDIDDFIDDSNVLEKSSAMVDQITVGHSFLKPNSPQGLNLPSNPSTSEEKDLETSSFVAANSFISEVRSELQTNSNITEEGKVNNAEKHGKISFDISGLSNLEFSLNGVTDSILNISHGSSLPSPPDTQTSVSHIFPKPNSFEDISCDGEHLDNVTDISIVDQIIHKENEDLHMSVDEDFQQQQFIVDNSINISQPSEYKSCPSACSSYSTAYDKTCGENNSNSEQSNSFQNYRDVSTDLDICAGIDAVSIKSDEENVNEASFEMVMQNRQNSFNDTPAPKVAENNEEEVKPKVVSKLPVFQTSKSLLKPPKLHVKPDTLKTASFKFARQISKAVNEKTSSNLPKPALYKLPGPSGINKHLNSPSVIERKILSQKEKTFTKTPATIGTPKQHMPTPMPKSKIPSQSYSSVNKTPAQNILNRTPAQKAVSKTPAPNLLSKTPAQNTLNKTPAKSTVNRTPAQTISGIPRAINSDSKAMRVLSPLSNSNLSAGKSSSLRNKYKNVISPIQAYIRGSPPVSQRKANFFDEEKYSPDGRESVPKALQKLKFDSVQGQENINPNVLDPSRDTIPCKVLEPSLEVFWKEREEPQPHLPKMGEKVTKILSGPPKVKVTVHEGRVNESPRSKGVLVPNNENSTLQLQPSSDIFNTENFPEQSDGRISVRIQKIAELP